MKQASCKSYDELPLMLSDVKRNQRTNPFGKKYSIYASGGSGRIYQAEFTLYKVGCDGDE